MGHPFGLEVHTVPHNHYVQSRDSVNCQTAGTRQENRKNGQNWGRRGSATQTFSLPKYWFCHFPQCTWNASVITPWRQQKLFGKLSLEPQITSYKCFQIKMKFPVAIQTSMLWNLPPETYGWHHRHYINVCL